jgi:hypothetical protein
LGLSRLLGSFTNRAAIRRREARPRCRRVCGGP